MQGVAAWTIILTLTTCRRPDLFVRTVRSIRQNCTDIEQVAAWVIVDDNTPVQHRKRMMDAVQGLNVTWIWKQPHEKGHARSMNVLRTHPLLHHADAVFHWEDDWQLVVPSNYVLRMTRALQEQPLLGQVLLNEHYREVMDDGVQIESHWLTPDCLVHRWDPHLPGRHSAYWPHYALRPGLMRREVWDVVGEYDESSGHFERQYADRYFHEHGYATGFLPGVNAVHLGKKTWEQEEEVPSAYTLNGVSRFE